MEKEFFELFILFSKGIVIFFFLATPWAFGILVPWLGIEPAPPSVEAWSPNYWTARKVPQQTFICTFYMSGSDLGTGGKSSV